MNPNPIFKETRNKMEALQVYSASEIAAHALQVMNLEYGIETWRQNNLAVKGRKFIGKKGVSDLIGFSRSTGHIAMCEVKAGKDKFSSDQITLLRMVHNAGGIALVAYQEGIRIKVTRFIDYIANKAA